MKVAVCISGVCKGNNVERNVFHLQKQFPFDFFYATWAGRERDLETKLPGVKYHLYDEPTLDYHPIADIDGPKAPKLMTQKNLCQRNAFGNYEKTKHHTKQILIHDMLLQDIPESYDMIIRARFDTYLSLKVNFEDYLNKSFLSNYAIGFGVRDSRHENVNVLSEIPKIYPDGKDLSISQDWGWYLMDPLIMHPRKLWDHERVQNMHKNKKLAAAEFGWYQILSEPYGDNHSSIYGGAHIDRFVRG